MTEIVCPFCAGQGKVRQSRTMLVKDIPLIERIIIQAAAREGVSPKNVVGPTRVPEFCRARNEAAWRLRKEVGLTLKEIGYLLGGRDHSTILHSIGNHQRRIEAAA